MGYTQSRKKAGGAGGKKLQGRRNNVAADVLSMIGE